MTEIHEEVEWAPWSCEARSQSLLFHEGVGLCMWGRSLPQGDQGDRGPRAGGSGHPSQGSACSGPRTLTAALPWGASLPFPQPEGMGLASTWSKAA